jgi:hypothetical protein
MSVEAFDDAVRVPTFGPRMICTMLRIVGADVRPNRLEQQEREMLTGVQWRQ